MDCWLSRVSYKSEHSINTRFAVSRSPQDSHDGWSLDLTADTNKSGKNATARSYLLMNHHYTGLKSHIMSSNNHNWVDSVKLVTHAVIRDIPRVFETKLRDMWNMITC